MNIKKTIVMWELSLKCNLSCTFCYQEERRNLQEKQIDYKDATKIVDNLPINTHIAFIGGESFLFPNFIDLLKYLDDKGLTYEITSNGTITDKFILELNKLENLTNINFSVDHLGQKQDLYRNYKGLFEKIKNTIPQLKTNVNINTIIFPNSNFKDILKLNLYFENLAIKEHTFLMYSSFSKKNLEDSLKIIDNLVINTGFEEGIDYINLRKKTLIFFNELYKLNKKNNLKSKLLLIPQGLILNKNTCKHLDNQYRINENGKLSICHYIDNEFNDLINNKFIDIIQNEKYLGIKEKIKNNFPLEICKNCCKIL